MKLPIPVFYNNDVIREIKIKKPKPKILAEAKEKIDRMEVFQAYAHVIAGGISSMTSDNRDYTEFRDINLICQNMPWQSAIFSMIQVFRQVNNQDFLRVFYSCELCKQDHIPGSPGNPLIAIDEIPINYMDHDNDKFDLILKNPATLMKGREEFLVTAITLEIPTLKHCMDGARKSNSTGRDFYIRAECIHAVNGSPIDPRWRNNWGYLLISNLDLDDHVAIGKNFNEFGMESSTIRECMRCRQPIDVDYDFSGFFSSGLRKSPHLEA